MQYLNPMESQAWPSEMMISVRSATPRMLRLLYLRRVYALDTEARLPALDPDPLERATAPADWPSDHWDKQWVEALGELMADERSQAAGQAPSRQAILEALDSSADDRYLVDSGLVTSFQHWQDEQQRRHTPTPVTLQDSPERKSLDAVIAAWEGGFTSCVLMPFTGVYASRLGRHILLASPGARQSADYGDLLRSCWAPN